MIRKGRRVCSKLLSVFKYRYFASGIPKMAMRLSGIVFCEMPSI